MARADWYVGYPVKALVRPHRAKKGERRQEWKFGLVLDGGTIIRFYKQTAPKESEVAGENHFISSVTNHADGSIDLVISIPTAEPPTKEMKKITVRQGEYSIVDDEGEEWFPVNTEQVELVVPEEPSERLQEAPEASESVETDQDA